MTQTLIEQFSAVRFASTPLVCIRTADPAATVNSIKLYYLIEKDGKKIETPGTPPILHWDIIRGLRPMNAAGEKAMMASGLKGGDGLVDPVAALQAAITLPGAADNNEPGGSIVFMSNMHRVINDNGVSQAIWNLRDVFKADQRTLVMLCPSITLPIELQSDVSMLDEPMPDMAHLERIVKSVYRSGNLEIPGPRILSDATDALCGLAAFPAEQACAESITRKGLNMEALWERKRKAVEQTPGLSIWRGNTTFDDMRGCGNAIKFLRMMMTGLDAPRVIVWQDEIEKQFAGFGGDLSGTTGEAMGYQLTKMQNNNWNGVLLIGPPGSGKSMLAQCCGQSYGKPTVEFNVSSTKAGIVGESEANMRQAMKVIESIGQNLVFFIATCNKFGNLPPEFRRRFKDATFYCDLPDGKTELPALWKLYIAKYKIPAEHAAIPASKDWTGAEVRQCCDLARRFNVPLTETAKYIVPVAKSAEVDIYQLRSQAHNTFISASYDGLYQIPTELEHAAIVDNMGVRKLDFTKAN